MAIRFFDMFAGIGGFRSGLEAVGGFECIGHCEIDKKANQAYNAIYQPKGEIYFEDATKIDTNDLPDIDLICAGFPCQSFSVAGKRLGFRDDTRGTLFFEVARIAEAKRPPLLLLENVPGLLSHDGGRTLFTIFSTLVELGYAKFVSAAKEGADCFIDWMRGSLFGQVAGMAILPSTLLGILPVGCLLYIHGTLSAETFLAVIVLSFGVMQPLITAFSYTDDIAQVKTIVGEVAEVLSGEDMQRPTTAEKLPADNAIELKDVRFAYHDKEVLHGVNLHIAPGTVNALVGPSGSGKSTIARLVASLWDVKDGAIELGGVDLRILPLAECTKRIAYVSQNNYLFDLSVMDNIRMGKKGASDEEVIAAAKKCGCHEFTKLPYSTRSVCLTLVV